MWSYNFEKLFYKYTGIIIISIIMNHGLSSAIGIRFPLYRLFKIFFKLELCGSTEITRTPNAISTVRQVVNYVASSKVD